MFIFRRLALFVSPRADSYRRVYSFPSSSKSFTLEDKSSVTLQDEANSDMLHVRLFLGPPQPVVPTTPPYLITVYS